MPRFFRRLAEGVFDEDDVRTRAHELADFVEEARNAYGIAAPIAVGYSNGANIAAAALLLTAAVALAQPAQKPFEPFSGQPGKDVVWVPTSQALVDKMLDMAKLTPGDIHMDLGSGDGRTVITAAKRGLRAMGI